MSLFDVISNACQTLAPVENCPSVTELADEELMLVTGTHEGPKHHDDDDYEHYHHHHPYYHCYYDDDEYHYHH